MKRLLKVFAVACVCALAMLTIAACSSPEVSRSTESETLSVEESESSEPISTDPVYMLLVGNDSRYETYQDKDKTIKLTDPTFGDTIMLMRLDPADNRISIVSIPRDTAVTLGENQDKINAVHYYFGAKGLAEEVGSMLGIEIPYYFDLRFANFQDVINKIGGVSVDVPMTISFKDIVSGKKMTVNAGSNVLDGAHALIVARVRKAYTDNGEAIRQMLARDIVANAIQTIAGDSSSDAASYASILESSSETNVPEEVLEAYVQKYLDNGGSIKFNLGTAPYTGGVDESGAWRVARDADAYAQIKDCMENGGDLTEVVPLPAVY